MYSCTTSSNHATRDLVCASSWKEEGETEKQIPEERHKETSLIYRTQRSPVPVRWELRQSNGCHTQGLDKWPMARQ